MKNKGFTIIEVLIVLVIVGILATTILINVNASHTKAKTAQTKTNISSFMTAASIYYEANKYYPRDGYPGDPVYPVPSELSTYFGQPITLDNFVDGWGTAMDWNNNCATGSCADIYRATASNDCCTPGKDNNPGPIGICSDGPDKTHSTWDDNICWGIRGHAIINWE